MVAATPNPSALNNMHWLASINSSFEKSFDLRTRASRREYWTFMAALAVLAIPWLAIDFLMGWLDQTMVGPLTMFYLIVTFFPNLSVTVRRLHDTDTSGWLYPIIFVPFLGQMIMITLMLSAGTKGPNRFGPVPYAMRDCFETTASN